MLDYNRANLVLNHYILDKWAINARQTVGILGQGLYHFPLIFVNQRLSNNGMIFSKALPK
jgi:hypothetical protein